jgi:hypothetical protein
MNKTTTSDRIVLTLVAVLILVCGGLVWDKAAATTNASMTVNSVCVDEAPVAQVTVTGDNEHPINVTGDLVGTIPINGTLTGTVPLDPGVERVVAVTVDRGDGPGKPFDLTQTVTGQTDCAPVEPPPTEPPVVKPPKTPEKPGGRCEEHVCARDLDLTHNSQELVCVNGYYHFQRHENGVLVEDIKRGSCAAPIKEEGY